jgi:divalent metal cation (Fe/Co/Zn/Cd) transporter
LPNKAARVIRDIVTTVVLLGLAAAEFIFGRALRNPAVMADAGHSATDAISTVVSATVKLITGNHASHWVKVHFPAKTAIWICWATIGGTLVVTVLELRTPGQVTVKSALTAVCLGAFGAVVRYGLAWLMDEGKEPTDRANASHLRTDARVSVFLAVCGVAVLGVNYWQPWLGPWLFRAGAGWIVWKAYKANRHIIEDIETDLSNHDCPPNEKMQLDE